MSLVVCLKKAGSALHSKDKAAILASSRAYRKDGMSAKDAAVKAVDDQLEHVKGLLKPLVLESMKAPVLSRPSEADVRAQQDRAAAAPATEAKQQIDREAQHQTLTQQTAPEQRKDTTGDLIGTTAAEALAAKRAADEAKAKPAEDDGTRPMFARAPQTDTEAFRKWFGDSKVVDADGNPAVVYHGTNKAFNKFSFKNAGQKIIWFTSDRSAIDAGEVGAAGRGKVMELYASLQNPASWAEYEKFGLFELKARGYDGAILKEGDGTFTGFAFESSQLKSATKNIGTFDKSNPDIRFKRESLTATGTGSMQASEVRKTLMPATARLKIPHSILQTVDEASKASGMEIPPDAKGFHWKGKVYLVAENIKNAVEAQEVLWHEVNHAGLAEAYGIRSVQYENALRSLSLQNKNIRDAAKVWMERFGKEDYDFRIANGMTPERAMLRTKLQAVDEALAEMAGRAGENINGLHKFIAKVQEFMRSIGLHDLAKWLESKTDSQALSMILGARAAVMDDAKTHGGGQMQPAFSKDKAQFARDEHKREIQVDGQWHPAENANGQPIHPTFEGQQNFWRFFAGSKVVDEQGRPIPVYHGTGRDFSEFKTADERAGGIRGTYFAENPKLATMYAEQHKGGEAVYPVYLNIKNPIDAAEIRKYGYEKGVHFDDATQHFADLGYDGAFESEPHHKGGKTRVWVAFSPNQIKSATGNRGTFDSASDNISFARAKASDEAPPKEEVKTPGAPAFQGVRDLTNGLVHDAFMHTAPMSLGTPEARAAAQKFANDMRAARSQWQRLNEAIKMSFTKDQRKEMWEAADEQNTLIQEGKDTTGKGLDRLNAKQQKWMNTLHEYGNELWKRAQDVGMVTGDGLPFWTPRVAVMIGEDGSFSKPSGEGKKATSAGVGRNVMTSAPSAMHRKHVGTTESEAALKAKIGENAEYVRDILTMPLAMSRFEQAIAGRELINTVKEIGLATGSETVNSTGGPGFFTLDHPAFTSYRPRMVTDAQGKTTPALDQNGEMVFDKVPLFISKDFEGPLKAVMSNKDGDIYSGYMLLKGKAMTSIMASPLTHNMVIYGRALAYSPAKVGSGYLYWKGHALAKDSALMDKFIRAGMVPIGANKNSMMDVTDVARGLGKQGSWGDPNESWVSLSAQKLGNALHQGWGDNAKAGLDAAGDFLHHTLLWKQVGAIQVGIANDARQHLMAKGFSDEAATQIAAHLSNRYAGAIAQENMSEMARKTANVLLFSRSFNMGNLGTMKDMFSGMPEGMKAKLMQDVGELEGKKALSYAKRKAIGTVIADVGIAVIATSLVQSAVNVMKKDKDLSEEAAGYLTRLSDMFENLKDKPLDPSSYNPYRLSPTWDNEPDKHDRIDMGEQPGGRHEYMRLPTGKVVEDMIGWAFHTGETFSKKMSPAAKAMWQDATNDKGFGVPVMDPEGGMLKHAYELAKHLAEAQLPWDTLKNVYDLTQGKATDLDKKKLAGFATGFTFSQGHPQGPEGAVAAKTEERVNASKKYLMEEVKRDLKFGDEDAAREKLEAIGLSTKEINMIIRRVEDPRSGLSKSARQRFNRHANEDERQQMERR